MKLTGVVAQNAIKDANGRAELRKISAFNKNELKNAVRDAVHKGEQRALQIEKKMENLKKTVAWAEGEFSKLNNDLKAEANKSEGERAALAAKIAKEKEHAVGQLDNAVAAQNKALLALTQETQHEIKKTNKRLSAHADKMISNAEKVRAEMKANTAAIAASLEAARKSD